MTAGSRFNVRPARASDIESILDLLTDYDLPRSYFVPFYRSDPTFRPEQSWLVEDEETGQLLAHARVFERTLYMGGPVMRVAGIGNVITRKTARGGRIFGLLMRGLLTGIQSENYAYSLLWTHLPELYARYGWSPLSQRAVGGEVRPTRRPPHRIVPCTPYDLTEVMRLYTRLNAGRTGPVVRSSEYWRGQRLWLRETPERFLVMRTESGRLAGYVRWGQVEGVLRILELGTEKNRESTGRALLSAVSTGQRLYARLPKSLLALFPGGSYSRETGLMGRVIHLGSLLATFQPIWQERITAASLRSGALRLRVAAGAATMRIQEGKLTFDWGSLGESEPGLREDQLGELLFHGLGATEAAVGFSGRADSTLLPLLQALFPEQDCILWQSDDY